MKIEKYNPTKIATSSWEGVRYWSGTAAKGVMISAAAMIMAGFTLNDLHKNKGIKAGTRTDLAKQPKEGNLPHSVGGSETPKSWPEMVKEYAGVSDETARRWMHNADGVKAKWKKNPPQKYIGDLMDTPMSDWSEEDTALVFAALSKAIDGSTMIEFMRELGLAKKAIGSGSTGRLPECDNSKKNLSLSEQIELRRAQAREDWAAMGKIRSVYRDKFVVLTDDEITAQVAELEQDLKARKAWLNQPASKRDAKAIEQMFNTK